jgi:hypothetical protein
MQLFIQSTSSELQLELIINNYMGSIALTPFINIRCFRFVKQMYLDKF